jgi:hypothetical protein
MTEIDWSALQKEAETAGLLPDGKYPTIVTKADAVTSSTGKPMIKLKLAVVEGPLKDRPLWTQLTLSPENPIALRMWFMQLKAFGIGQEFFATKPSMETLASTLVNRGCVVTVSTREWAGSDRNSVDKIEAFTGSGPTPPGMVTGAPTAGPGPLGSTTPGPAVGPTAGPVVPTTPAAPTSPAATSTPTDSPASSPPGLPF